MMNPKVLFDLVYRQIYNYNLFMHEEDDYDDDVDNEPRDSTTIVKHQKYTTWLYVLLLMVLFYVLFYITLTTPQSRTITVSDVTPGIAKELSRKHGESLSCPCSTITVPYKNFVSNTIKFHSICSSIFVSDQWIQALYFVNASRYGVTDFRTTANAQFQLLADFCSFSKLTVYQSQNDLDNNEFVTTNLVSETEIQSAANAIAQFFKTTASTQIILFLNYMRTFIQINYIVSALNTNMVFIIAQSTSDVLNLERSVTVQQNTTSGIRVEYDQSINEIEWYTNIIPQRPTLPKHRLSSRAAVTYSGSYGLYQAQTQYEADVTDPSNPQEVSCGNANPTSAAGFFSSSTATDIFSHKLWVIPSENSELVNGFFGACTPLEAVLPSTLDCLYDVECLQLLIKYFPGLSQMNFNVNESFLSSNKQNKTLNDYLIDLFVEEWSIQMNYSKYFDGCAPSFCSYTITDQSNWSYAVTLLISLYGGLVILIRLIAPFLIKIVFKLKHPSNLHPRPSNTHIKMFMQAVKQLNLFTKADDRSEESIKRQKLTTRIYLILLIGSILVLLFFTIFSTETVTTTVSNPSLNTYNNLQTMYSQTLQCPCSTTTIPYEKFTSLSPILHQVCSSDFISDHWLFIIRNAADYIGLDWRNTAYSTFHLLSELCQQANSTIEDSVNHFLSQSFIASSVISEFDFNTQLNATLNQFFQSTIISFSLLVDTVGLLMQVDQPHLGQIALYNRLERDKNVLITTITDPITNEQSLKVIFQSNQVVNVNLTSVECICNTDPHCQASVGIYGVDFAFTSKMTFSIDYIVPYSVASCSPFTSLLLSQLECLYVDSICFLILMNYVQDTYVRNVEYSSWFNPRPLVYDPRSSHYPPNSSISEIVEGIMLEQWNPSYSYNQFYELCAPKSCTYSEKIRTKTIFGAIITLISLIAGLTVSLSLITPLIITFIFELLAKIKRRNTQEHEPVHLKWYQRVQSIVENSIRFVFNFAATLNIFRLRDFGSKPNRNTFKRHGQWATRLYFLLLIIGISILILYTILQTHTVTNNFRRPSYNFYKHLEQIYGDQLKCSCSSIASSCDQFVNIEAIFHPVCTSQFISEEFRLNLTAKLYPDLSIYEQRDYRRFLSAHFQFLQGLCELSIKSVDNSINQLLTSLFITAQLLSENEFNDRVISLIEQSKSDSPITITRLLYLIRNINQANAAITTYGTNFEYTSVWYDPVLRCYVPTQAIIYDNQCSCGLNSNCTTQANFIQSNSSEMIPIKGLKMGCLPSESFRASTLECFYDQICLDLIQQYTNYSNYIPPLSTTMSQYSINTSLAQLIDNLFIEQWSITKNYSSYFESCAPLLCSYSYTQYFNLLYVIIALLGLEGGLTIVLKWICPKIIRIIAEVYEHQKRRTNVVHIVSSPEITNESICDLESTSTNVITRTNLVSFNRSYFKFVIMCLMLLLIITGLILFSIYISRQENQIIILTSSLMTTTVETITSIKMTSTTTTSTTPLPVCQLKFEVTTSYRSGSDAGIKSPVVADFDGDNRTDVVFFDYGTFCMNIWLGDGNGSFKRNLTIYLGKFDGWSFLINVGDFNNDNKLDLVFTNEDSIYVFIMFGNGDGTFQMPLSIPVGNDIYLKGIAVSHFNDDNYLDVAVIDYWNNYLHVLLGVGNGSFLPRISYYTGRNSYPFYIGVADFDNDGYQDIAVSNCYKRSIGIFLGYGNGTFQEQISSFTGGYYYPYFIMIGEFNGDHRPDVAIGYDVANAVGILLGHGNGTLGPIAKFPAGNVGSFKRITVGDMNGDGNMDVVASPIDPYDVCILIGYGNGEFQTQTVFPTGLNGSYTWVDVADFNGDNCQDILASDEITGIVSILLNTCNCRTT